ncbi:hypothetical protein NW765_001992 [Fusarium oxysporum]|nr:hypothetical protein NW765_001992 [Fusarium oxysporum]
MAANPFILDAPSPVFRLSDPVLHVLSSLPSDPVLLDQLPHPPFRTSIAGLDVGHVSVW